MTLVKEQIKKHIVEQLYWDDRVDASDITVEVREGKVILGGTVPDFSAKTIAEADASIVPGLVSVENNIKVKQPVGQKQISDSQLKENIEATLSWSAEIDPSDIQVTVKDGVVFFTGYTNAYWKKIRAEDLIRSMSGIKDISNKIVIIPSRQLDDELIANDIIEALDRTIGSDISRQLDIKVHAGLVTLSGSVPDIHVYHNVLDTARHTLGVIDVINDLMIG